MRRQFITSIIMLACLTAVAATTVNAQSTRRFIIRIPFEFVVGDRALPAGKYVVERIDPTKPNVVMLKNTDNGIVRLVITQRVEKDETTTASSLIFKRRSGEFYLFQVWVIGNKDGNQVPPPADENNRSDKHGSSTFVVLKINHERP